MNKALVILSGGQDSTTCLFWAINRFNSVEAIGFNYGQTHSREIHQAQLICDILGIKYTVLNTDILSNIGDSALVTGSDVKAAHDRKDLPASWVPNRNAFFFLVAHAVAQKKGIKHLVTGVCQTDYSGYPDCRQDFVNCMSVSLNMGSDADIQIHTPLMYLTKKEIFAMADMEGGLDVVIDHSLTCYNGSIEQNDWGYGCSDCPACKLRKAGWEEYQESIR